MKTRSNFIETKLIPEGWDSKTIGEVALFSGGSQPPRNNFSFKQQDGYIRLIQIRDYKSDEFKTYIPEFLAKKKCTEDDIMIGRYGPPIFQILRGINGAYNVALIKVIPLPEIDREYLYFILKQEALFQFIESLSRRSSGQTGVEMGELKKYPLPLPPLPEQKRIAEVLSDTDRAIAALDRLIAKKRDIKQATMQQLLTGKTRLPGFSGEWEEKKLSDLANVDSESLGSDTRPDYEFQYISLEDVDRGSLTNTTNIKFQESPSRARRIIRKKDILFSTVRPALKSHLFVDFECENFICSTGFSVIRCHSQNNSQFIFYALLSFFTDSQIEKILVGSNYPAINSSDVKNLKIVLPKTEKEQKEIAQVLTDIDTEIETLEKKRDKYKQIKQGMMQELLTGRTRLIHPDPQP